MANGLLNGLVEYWQPDAVLGSLKGMVAGIDFDTAAGFDIVDFPTPSGKAVRVNTALGNQFKTDTNPLLAEWGSTSDFLIMAWMQLGPVAGYFEVGETGTTGADVGMFANDPTHVYGETPFADQSYSPFINSGTGFLPPNTLNCFMFWWTLADKTIHLQISGGTELTQTSLQGMAAPDPTNRCYFQLASNGTEAAYQGDGGAWRGTIPDAAQRALLFAGIPFDQFDDGGGEESVSKMEVINQTAFDGLASGASLKASCSISASKTSGALASAQNPTGAAVIATLARVHVKTGSSAACTADVGTASTLVTNDGLLDGLSVNAAANTVYDNITDHGTNGRTRQYVAAGGYFTAFVASGDANGLVADFYWNYQTLTGGTVFTPGSL